MNLTLYHSFYITYAFLVTTGTITFIESMRTQIEPCLLYTSDAADE